MVLRTLLLLATAAALVPVTAARADEVRVKNLGRFAGWQDNALVGYGIVTGLAGSGDSPRSAVTKQTLSNVLGRLGVNIAGEDLASRNVAAVIVTAKLPPAANIGDKISVTVTSIGDARSLAGGTLLMTPLLGPDRQNYAIAQGSLVVGGYEFQEQFNLRQKNYPTAGVVPDGGTIEAQVAANILDSRQQVTFILKDPDFTTAQRISTALDGVLGPGTTQVRGADAVLINARNWSNNLSWLIARIENVHVTPDVPSRIVINERSGTVVAGGDIRISSVVVAQGDIKVSVVVDNQASQPGIYGGYVPGAQSLIVTNTKLSVDDQSNDAVVKLPNTTVADLVQALSQAKLGTRSVISILQAVKAAGALHADIVVQ